MNYFTELVVDELPLQIGSCAEQKELTMIDDAEASGAMKPGPVIIQSTSSNMGPQRGFNSLVINIFYRKKIL